MEAFDDVFEMGEADGPFVILAQATDGDFETYVIGVTKSEALARQACNAGNVVYIMYNAAPDTTNAINELLAEGVSNPPMPDDYERIRSVVDKLDVAYAFTYSAMNSLKRVKSEKLEYVAARIASRI